MRAPPDLERMIREAQDRLRGRPQTLWERSRDEFTSLDWFVVWAAIGLAIAVILR